MDDSDQLKNEVEEVNSKISRNEKLIDILDERYIKNEIDKYTYDNLKDKYKKEINELKIKKESMDKQNTLNEQEKIIHEIADKMENKKKVELINKFLKEDTKDLDENNYPRKNIDWNKDIIKNSTKIITSKDEFINKCKEIKSQRDLCAIYYDLNELKIWITKYGPNNTIYYLDYSPTKSKPTSSQIDNKPNVETANQIPPITSYAYPQTSQPYVKSPETQPKSPETNQTYQSDKKKAYAIIALLFVLGGYLAPLFVLSVSALVINGSGSFYIWGLQVHSSGMFSQTIDINVNWLQLNQVNIPELSTFMSQGGNNLVIGFYIYIAATIAMVIGLSSKAKALRLIGGVSAIIPLLIFYSMGMQPTQTLFASYNLGLGAYSAILGGLLGIFAGI